MIRPLLLVALVACSGTAPPTAAPIAGHPDSPAPRGTPPPTIGWQGTAFAITGLPAVARAGELAVVAISGGDGGRGFPNLRLEVRGRGDQVLQQIEVLTSNELEALAPGGVPGPGLQQRIAAANRELATLHGVHDLVAMHPLEVQPPGDGGERHFATGDGLDVDWNVSHLHVFHHNADHELATINGAAWLVAPHKPCPQCDPCENRAFLANAYHATEVSVLVIEIGYTGTDTCWEPANQLHVVTW